jgi:hypothetical protein
MVSEFLRIRFGKRTTAASTTGRPHRGSPSLETVEERILLASTLHDSPSSNCLAVGHPRMTSHRLRRKNELPLVDRLVSTLPSGLCGLATMAFTWLLVFSVVSVPFDDVVWMLCTWTTCVAGVVGAAAGFLLRPERVMDGFGKVWGAIYRLLRAGIVEVGRRGSCRA